MAVVLDLLPMRLLAQEPDAEPRLAERFLASGSAAAAPAAA